MTDAGNNSNGRRQNDGARAGALTRRFASPARAPSQLASSRSSASRGREEQPSERGAAEGGGASSAAPALRGRVEDDRVQREQKRLASAAGRHARGARGDQRARPSAEAYRFIDVREVRRNTAAPDDAANAAGEGAGRRAAAVAERALRARVVARPAQEREAVERALDRRSQELAAATRQAAASAAAVSAAGACADAIRLGTIAPSNERPPSKYAAGALAPHGRRRRQRAARHRRRRGRGLWRGGGRRRWRARWPRSSLVRSTSGSTRGPCSATARTARR